jgi:uncharacterized protein (DUF433 family)
MVSMTQTELLSRITSNPKTFAGKPCIRGSRIPVELILSLIAQGETFEDLLLDYPHITRDDILACVAYAHAFLAGHSLEAVEVKRA